MVSLHFILVFSILIGFSRVNVSVDAYKITVLYKEIRHFINFSAYAAVCAAAWWFFMPHELGRSICFAIHAFCLRQIYFDIPLNLKRKLPADYLTSAEKAAVWDKIERKLFANGEDANTTYRTYLFITGIYLVFN